MTNPIGRPMKYRPFLEVLKDDEINTPATIVKHGICLVVEGSSIKGSSLGKAFSWHGRQHHLGVRYHPDRDNPMLQQIQNRKITSPPRIQVNPLSNLRVPILTDGKKKDPLSPAPNPPDFSESIQFLTRAVMSIQTWQKGRWEEEEKDGRGSPNRSR